MRNGVGWIQLNRPRSINSLQVDMVEIINSQLEAWKTDHRIALICIEGEGDKGLCAGGDMRELYQLKDGDIDAYAERFFSIEYQMNYQIHHYPKPVIAFMNGVVMGGGVGLSIGASHRIVTQSTQWAMPEMNIGFFPDVGASYFLNLFPGSIGRYLALTSRTITMEDVLYIGAGDYYLKNEQWEPFRQLLRQKTWSAHSVQQELEQLVQRFCSSPQLESLLALQRDKIDEHFKWNNIEEVVSSLKEDALQGNEWAKQTLDTMLAKSPISLKVTLRQLQEGNQKSLKECFEMELNLAMNFMKCHDFFEGVRSVLVDKDRNPKWKSAELDQVTENQVAAFFTYPWKHGKNPFIDAFQN